MRADWSDIPRAGLVGEWFTPGRVNGGFAAFDGARKNDLNLNTTNNFARANGAIQFGQAYGTFNGALAPIIDNATALSLCGWIYALSNTSQRVFVQEDDSVGDNYELTISVNGPNGQFGVQGTSGVASINFPLSLLTWTHFAATYAKNGGLKIYLNGKFSTSTTNSVSALGPTAGGIANFCRTSSGTAGVTRQFQGQLQFWLLYSRAISDVEAQQIYSAEKGFQP